MLDDIEIGEGFMARNMTVFPLFRPGRDGDYLTLDEALERETARLVETGEVSWADLEVRDNGGQPVFIVDGEGLVGARQNRVVNTAVLAEPGRIHRLPVSCVEQGRWSGGEVFRPGSSAYPSLRACLASSVNASLKRGKGFSADQAAVWSSVKQHLSSLRVSSATSSMHDAYDAVAKALAAYTEGDALEGASGFMAFAGEEFLGADVLPGPRVFSRLRKKLLESYALDAMIRMGKPAPFTEKGAARELLSALGDLRWQGFAGVSLGTEQRAEGRGLVARALVQDGMISFSGFPKP